MAKRTLYVGGLEESVTPAKLTAAFIPFGDITQVEIPVDPGTRTCWLPGCGASPALRLTC